MCIVISGYFAKHAWFRHADKPVEGSFRAWLMKKLIAVTPLALAVTEKHKAKER
jgi:hypothetical protein